MSDNQFFTDAALPATGAWDDETLEPMYELNAEVLEAHAGAVAALQWQWSALGEEARRRLCRCPFLLVDAGFARPGVWAPLAGGGVHEAGPGSAAPGDRPPLATPLLRRVLLFAWHLARANRLAARIALGMSADCAAIVARCSLADLDALARCRPAWIRPRWEHQTGIWQAWLAAAARESPQGLESLHLWGLQMLAAELLGPQAARMPLSA